jgi:hypothetical protein
MRKNQKTNTTCGGTSQPTLAGRGLQDRRIRRPEVLELTGVLRLDKDRIVILTNDSKEGARR